MFNSIKLRGVLESTPAEYRSLETSSRDSTSYGVQIAHYHSRFGELSITKLNRKNLCLRFEPVKAENLRSFYSISTYELTQT